MTHLSLTASLPIETQQTKFGHDDFNHPSGNGMPLSYNSFPRLPHISSVDGGNAETQPLHEYGMESSLSWQRTNSSELLQQQHQQQQQQQQQPFYYPPPASPSPGELFYPRMMFVPSIRNAPVSSMAFSHDRLYVASHSIPLTESPSHSGRSRVRAAKEESRGSILATHFLDGETYSSIVAHPTRPPKIADAGHDRETSGPSNPPSPRRRQFSKIPARAYAAPYLETPSTCDAGITSLTLWEDPTRTITAGPHGIRVHDGGGLLLSDVPAEGRVSCGLAVDGRFFLGGGDGDGIVRRYDLRPTARPRLPPDREIDLKSGIRDLKRLQVRGGYVAGCADGRLKFVDDKKNVTVADVKAHAGGVNCLAVAGDGNTICSTGMSGGSGDRGYAFPDPFVLVFDARMLGRGGIPLAFAGSQGGPRFIDFLPNEATPTLVVGSAQIMGGVQIMKPLEHQAEGEAVFFQPDLEQGERITSLSVAPFGGVMGIGTNRSKVILYQRIGYEDVVRGLCRDSKSDLPSNYRTLTPPPPLLSIPPHTLIGNESLQNHTMGLFNSYTLIYNPVITPKPITSMTTLKIHPKRILTKVLQKKAGEKKHDFVASVLSEDMGLVSLGTKNPNKLLFSSKKLVGVCYEVNADPRVELNRTTASSKLNATSPNKTSSKYTTDHKNPPPPRYKHTLRPARSIQFLYSSHNRTHIWPGWDTEHNTPNAYAAPIVLLLYFLPEVRSAILPKQYSRTKEDNLTLELSFLFHQIEKHAISAKSHTANINVGVFDPSSFLLAFASLPEAGGLALLDGSPSAIHLPKRIESFYRFLLYHIDRQATDLHSLQGLQITSINEFKTGSGPPTKLDARGFTVDLNYDRFLRNGLVMEDAPDVPFGQVLRYSLSKEMKLRAWCPKTECYETVVQKKIARNLPRLLAICCSCAGGGEGGALWKRKKCWLPEVVEIEILKTGEIVVRELIEGEWVTFSGDGATSGLERSNIETALKVRYKLIASVSFIQSKEEDTLSEPSAENTTKDQKEQGHHVVHMRLPISYTKEMLSRQISELNACCSNSKSFEERVNGIDAFRKSGGRTNPGDIPHMTLSSLVPSEEFQDRLSATQKHLDASNINHDTAASPDDKPSQWVLFNGFVVSPTDLADVRDFREPYKEPCIVLYRDVRDLQEDDDAPDGTHDPDRDDGPGTEGFDIPESVMLAPSVTSARRPAIPTAGLPGEGDLVAIDTEFVLVQHEESVLKANGSKVTVTEGRHALARVSVIDCRTERVIIDDFILPPEPVVDYLTRFSGIHSVDLDPVSSTRHLITMRSAYLKLRLLVDRGCIFIGHGLHQDFRMVNIFVPPSQIIDTVVLFHLDNMRMISLRFLANYLLCHDMQQDTHDSIEDAKTAYEIYLKALEYKAQGTFEKLRMDIYDFGRRSEWKVGADVQKYAT